MSKQNFVQVIDGSERCLNGHPIVQAVWDGTPWLCADGTCEYSIKNVEPKPPNTTPLNEELDRLHQKYLNREIDGNQYKQELTNLIQTLEKKAYENGLHDGEQVATFVFIKRLQARKKNTAPNSGAGREIKDLLKELEK